MSRAPYRSGDADVAHRAPSPPLPALREGELIVVPQGTSFPKICVKCGSRRELLFRTNRFAFAHQPSTGKRLMWGAMFGALGGAIAAAQSTEYATFTLPICPRCNARWTDARIASFVSFLPFIGVGIWLFALWINRAPGGDVVVPGVAFVGTVAILALVHRLFVPPRTVRCVGIEGKYVKLSGIADDAKATLLGERSAKKKKKKS